MVEATQLQQARAVAIATGAKQIDYSHVVQAVNQNREFTCVPRQTGDTELLAIILDYVKKHPEAENDSHFLLTLNALHESFPCGR